MAEEQEEERVKPTWPEWRRLKKSARERFDEPFFFEVGGRTLKILQDDIGCEHNLAVGLTVWDAALVLSKYLEHAEPELQLKGKRVIELGSGTGLSGLSAAALGGKVILTDVPWLVNFLKENVTQQENVEALAASGGSVEVRELSWRSSPELVLESLKESGIQPFGQGVELIVAADVIYTNEAVPMLLTTLWTLASAETPILLAGEQHNPGSYRVFHERVNEFFDVEEIPPERQHPVYNFHPTIRLWSLKKKTGASGPFPHLG